MAGERLPNTQAIVDGLLSAVTARYGDRFSSDDEQQIRTQLEDLVDAAQLLRRVPLVNGDEPDLNFVPLREDV